MENRRKETYTYVLFGREAIQLYKLSMELLLDAINLKYKVGAYADVKQFVNESKKWDDFMEIDKDSYEKLKENNYAKRRKKNKNGFSILKIFNKEQE